ncbi:putative UDP-N-acetylglucosamine 1-carboxyvinyltransferase [Rosa chinensis]|uniref:UDP-N-acetylglucosamine 1-carboxyvinyltransferase n=2 Tax=Rosa chinensis TaxID=74649 RepID=A0A2P6QA76_ROSCH|nr:putative UDP-N-acetylglucosamine 1-carboxyvinyltransferase [Rosa chinensis]
MAACMADGTTILSSVARQEATKFVIKGKSYFHGCKCTIAPDRIEAGTFLLAAAIARSFISISPVIPSQVSCLMQKLLAAGCKIRQCSHDTLEVFSAVSQCGENLRGFKVKTRPFPWFPKDLQPQTMALLTTCNGLSPVEESVFEKRMANVNELRKLGAKIQVCASSALVFGKDNRSGLSGSCLAATDLRGGISLVLAALAA